MSPQEMYLQVIPGMELGDLEKILRILPEPTSAEVSLHGDFDYSSISSQVKELKLIRGVKLLNHQRETTFEIKPSKEKILEIYRESYHRRNAGSMEYEPKVVEPRVIDLNKVEWNLDDVQIELTPREITVKYCGREPKYVARLRKALPGRDVSLTIEVGR